MDTNGSGPNGSGANGGGANGFRVTGRTSPENVAIELARRLRERNAETPPSVQDYYHAIVDVVQDRLKPAWDATNKAREETHPKHINYLSIEWLLGPHTLTALHATKLNSPMRKALALMGEKPDKIREILSYEPDPGEGNGGLGQLAKCFADSAANLALPFMGYGLLYKKGFFKQDIDHEGKQVVGDDEWLKDVQNRWGFVHPTNYTVHFFGDHSESADLREHHWNNAITVNAEAHDVPIPSYDGKTVNTLRLWNIPDRDLPQGDSERDKLIRQINDHLYPKNEGGEYEYQHGARLRLMQEYYFTSLSLQDVIHRHLEHNPDLSNLAETAAVQMNDTHPAIAVAELIRLLRDEHNMSWEEAKKIARSTCFYTNHTLMPEALEQWPERIFKEVLPVHFSIVQGLDNDLKAEVDAHPGVPAEKKDEFKAGVALLHNDVNKKTKEVTPMVRMGHLAAYYASRVNGVSAMHSQLVADTLFPEAKILRPHVDDPIHGDINHVINFTNGISPRRWLLESNPKLAALITRTLKSDAWVTDLTKLDKGIEPLMKDIQFRTAFAAIKQDNKKNLIDFIHRQYAEENANRRAQGKEERAEPVLDPNALFDVQIKRMHAYKRQYMNILQTVALYLDIKDDIAHDRPNTRPDIVKIFAGKAAPTYQEANEYVELMNRLADIINNDREIGNRLKVAFVKNYNVSAAKVIIPAADISEQISTAGTEASGTSNMKFALNGALTLGTHDGANVEIGKRAGDENIFFFGKSKQEIDALGKVYDTKSIIDDEHDTRLKRALAYIENLRPLGTDPAITPDPNNDTQFPFRRLVNSITKTPDDHGYIDKYKVIADFADYANTHERAQALYKTYADRRKDGMKAYIPGKDGDDWLSKSMVNTRAGSYFSSDDTIKRYSEMWKVGQWQARNAEAAAAGAGDRKDWGAGIRASQIPPQPGESQHL